MPPCITPGQKSWNPATTPSLKFRPPVILPVCGPAATIRAGVHKAPANEVVQGVVRLAYQNPPRAEQDTLNPMASTVCGPSLGRGIRVLGCANPLQQPSWRYINVRRLFNYVEKSIENVPSGWYSNQMTASCGPASIAMFPLSCGLSGGWRPVWRCSFGCLPMSRSMMN